MLEDAEALTSLPCADIDRAKKYYKEKLGLTPKEEIMGNAQYEIGGSKFFLYPSTYAGTNEATAICFNVGNVKNTCADLKNNGVTFEQYDIPGITREGDIYTDGEGFAVAWFKDSEGNIISVTQSG